MFIINKNIHNCVGRKYTFGGHKNTKLHVLGPQSSNRDAHKYKEVFTRAPATVTGRPGPLRTNYLNHGLRSVRITT